MKTFYDILNIAENATIDEITDSYNNLKNKYESYLLIPEKKERAEEYLSKLEVAYKVLGNEETRKSYDKDLVSMRNDELMSNLQKNTSEYNKELEEKEAIQREQEEKNRQDELKKIEEENQKKKMELVQEKIQEQIRMQQEKLNRENELRKKVQNEIDKEYKKYVEKNQKYSIKRTLIAIIVVFGVVFIISRIPFVKDYFNEKMSFLKSIFG